MAAAPLAPNSATLGSREAAAAASSTASGSSTHGSHRVESRSHATLVSQCATRTSVGAVDASVRGQAMRAPEDSWAKRKAWGGAAWGLMGLMGRSRGPALEPQAPAALARQARSQPRPWLVAPGAVPRAGRYSQPTQPSQPQAALNSSINSNR